MSRRKRQTNLSLTLCALLCAFAFVSVAAVAQKSIKKDEARKLIAALSILELNKAAVTIKEISAPGATATVLAGVKVAFRFAKDAEGRWRVVEVRTGDRQWESFDLLARALGDENILPARVELELLAAELAATGKNKNTGTGREQSANELRRGALSVRHPTTALSALLSSAVVEAEVDTAVDFAKDVRGRWQASRVRLGERNFTDLNAFERALEREKRDRAHADLETLAAALEAYRREHGFYVVADSAATLVDHLNPRYTSIFIRFDPWHRPYEYAGTRAGFTLRSRGADGKANTPDDVTKSRDEGKQVAAKADDGKPKSNALSAWSAQGMLSFILHPSLNPSAFILIS